MNFEEYKNRIKTIKNKIKSYNNYINELEEEKINIVSELIKSTYLYELKDKFNMFYDDDYKNSISISDVNFDDYNENDIKNYVYKLNIVNDEFIINKDNHEWICNHVSFKDITSFCDYVEKHNINIMAKNSLGHTILFYMIYEHDNELKDNPELLCYFFDKVEEGKVKLKDLLEYCKEQAIEIPEKIKNKYSDIFDSEELGLL